MNLMTDKTGEKKVTKPKDMTIEITESKPQIEKMLQKCEQCLRDVQGNKQKSNMCDCRQKKIRGRKNI